MLAAIFKGNGVLELQEVENPKLQNFSAPKKYKKTESVKFNKDDLVLLKVLAASICGTDLHILSVPPGHDATEGAILGHEYIGEVLEKGDNVTNVKVGDKVVVDANIKCDICWYCKNDLASLCRDMTTLGIFCDGGFTEYNIAPAKQLYVIPDDLDLEQAIFFEPLSCAVHCWSKINFKAGDNILIFGGGPMGCYFVELARISGAEKIFVVEPNDFRKKFAEDLGAQVLNPNDNLEKIIGELTAIGVDAVIDACGKPQVINTAMDLVRCGGIIATFGQQNVNAFADKVSFTKVTQKELTIVGSYVTTRSAHQTINILKRKDLNLKKLITHRMSLKEIHQGIELMKKGSAVEVVIL